MRNILSPILLFIFFVLVSCKQDEIKKDNMSKNTTTHKISENKEPKKYFKSAFKPNQKIELSKIYENTVEFIGYNDDGDYSLMNVKEGSFIYKWEKTKVNDFCRGDILSVKWKMDSIWIAGDGETLDFAEIGFEVKKIEDGKVSKFRKKYKEPLSYHHNYQERTDWFFDKIYLIVEYYIANSKNVLFNNYENIKIEYSIEDNNKDGKDGKDYYLIGIYDNTSHQNSIIQWLYIDSETYELFEYDLPNDKLIKFN